MGVAASALRGIIRVYQLCLSPFCAGSCRYLPSCSEYARDAIAQHGARRGAWLGLTRVLRCHPWGGDGYDPVPPACDSHCHGHAGGAAAPRAGAR
ncbi:MAG: membrane protein insertion efficiency factor YidD [Alphaproteobacteria bacterium]|nr:membrane protein insertion efficiency factor YidD [Alphaproteobacteria bacterium]